MKHFGGIAGHHPHLHPHYDPSIRPRMRHGYPGTGRDMMDAATHVGWDSNPEYMYVKRLMEYKVNA
jgi:hypothetical protein